MESIKPLGGFIGRYEQDLRRMDPELFSVQSSQVLFDTANVPPPPLEQFGLALKATRQSSFHIDKSGARMRTFSPRPDTSFSLDLVRSTKRDLGVPGNQQRACLVLPKEAVGNPEKFYLMHEFTTDILRLQFQKSSLGSLLLTSPDYVSRVEMADLPEKKKYLTMLTYTVAQALCTGGARYLGIGPRDLAFTLRSTPNDTVTGEEFIFYDTAPGGAGFCDQLLDDVPSWFKCAVEVLDCAAKCGDSCYSCLRGYENQLIHISEPHFRA